MSEGVTDSGSIPEKVATMATEKGLRGRLAKDRMATRVVSASGFMVIFFILAIFFVIAAEVFPLFQSPEVSLNKVIDIKAKGTVLAFATEEYKTIAYTVTSQGIFFQSLKGGNTWPPVALPDLDGARITSASTPQNHMVVLGLSDGRSLGVQIKFDISFNEKNERSVHPGADILDFVQLSESGRPIELIHHHVGDAGYMVTAVTGPNEVAVVQVKRKKNMMGVVRTKTQSHQFTLPNKGAITALAMDHELSAVYAGTESGQVIRLALPTDEIDSSAEIIGATPGKAVKITVLKFLKGGMTLILGDAEGRVISSQIMKGDDQRYHLSLVHGFESHAGAVRAIGPSHRDKGFVTTGDDGMVRYHFGTSGQTEYELDTGWKENIADLVMAPKGDGILALDGKGRLGHWTVSNPHPGITLRSLFGKVRYEGYENSEYSWQSTGGTDEFEPKFSLTPLIFGTLKGTLYAMLFAAPLALFAAFYSSQFMHDSLVHLVKPTVEFMAALPSVVLGFFAALWLAPRVEELLPSLLMMPLVIGLLVVVVQYIAEHTDLRFYFKEKPATEFYFLLILVLIGTGLALGLGIWFESVLLQGDFRVWLLDAAGLGYDQRNSLVVGMAMGFAVIPIIFTIAEDSLSSVPKLLSAGSLALGATRWQTAVRVVLPTASPGIFSALMIGFGRAVGETMIVLMATGNTPIMDLSAFSGFRALSANIAVELPEAPEGGTLFRILFLAALLLFLFTFVVNSIAEWVRLKLREKYRVL